MIASTFLKKACKKFFYSNYKSLGYQTNQVKIVAHTPTPFVETGSLTSQVTASDATYIYIASGAEDGALPFYLHVRYTNPVTLLIEDVYKYIPSENLAAGFATEVLFFAIVDNPSDAAIVDAFEGSAPPMVGYVAEFFRPFLLTGLGTQDDIGSPTTYPAAGLLLEAPGNVSPVSNLFVTLFIAMMEANRDYNGLDYSTFTSVKYTGKWANYYDNWLNENLKPENYNSFLWTENEVKQFWDSENTTPFAETFYQRFRSFMKNLFEGSDRALWGAPGKYFFNTATGSALKTQVAQFGGVTDGNPIPPGVNPALYCDSDFAAPSSDMAMNYIDPNTPFLLTNNCRTRFFIAKNSAPPTEYYNVNEVDSPDFDGNPGAPGNAATAYLIAKMQAITGDAPLAPYSVVPADMQAGWSVNPKPGTDSAGMALGTPYNLGLIAAGANNGKICAMVFEQDTLVNDAPWIDDFISALGLSDEGDEIILQTLEQKSIE